MKQNISFKVTLDVHVGDGELSEEVSHNLCENIHRAIFNRGINGGMHVDGVSVGIRCEVERLTAGQEHTAAAVDACQDVIDNWESGDLAAAVRECQKIVDSAPLIRSEVENPKNADEVWARVELFRWQYGELPAHADTRPLIIPDGLEGLCRLLNEMNPDTLPPPSNVRAALKYVIRVLNAYL